MSHCRPFKTLREHAEAIAPILTLNSAGMKEAYLTSIEEQFAQLIERGLLISESALLDRLQSAERVDDLPPPISNQCLRSFIENVTTHGRVADFVVMDDSKGLEVRAQTREMLSELKRRYGVHVYYAGKEEKAEFAAALTADGDLSPEVVDFALFGTEGYRFTGGANQNALQLHTVGEMFYSTDDDIVCRLAATPEERASQSGSYPRGSRNGMVVLPQSRVAA